jgi:prostaglandin-endoperoxide synthase 2
MSLLDLFLKIAEHTPVVGDGVNRIAINHFAGSTTPRPRPYSLWSAEPAGKTSAPEYVTDYTSWPGLTNKQYSARHLPPADPGYVAGLPRETPYTGPETPVGPVTALFSRAGRMTTSRSSLLFTFFAQWFTDSVLRINPADRRKNTSNHDIDLCQVYGLTEESTRLLRRLDGSGQLRSQRINGEEYPEYLCREVPGGFRVRPEFEDLRATAGLSADAVVDAFLAPSFLHRKNKLYATGLERGNSSIGYVAISSIFLREHNRIAAQLKQDNKSWSDERIFQTARNVNVVLLLKLVVEDYINHIVGHELFKLDHSFAEQEDWYRPNWIAVEFDLLYRWHGLCPDAIGINGEEVKPDEFRNNNARLEKIGVGKLIDAASRQRAGKIGLSNTPGYLWAAESQSIKMGRDFRLRPYNEYRARFGLKPCADFSDLTSDTALQEKLRGLYRTIDNLEFVVGLFAEEADDGALFGDLLSKMVAYDAFTQIFSNPLLSTHVYGEATFTAYGLELIENTRYIEDLVNRNVATPVRASLNVLPGT